MAQRDERTMRRWKEEGKVTCATIGTVKMRSAEQKMPTFDLVLDRVAGRVSNEGKIGQGRDEGSGLSRCTFFSA